MIQARHPRGLVLALTTGWLVAVPVAAQVPHITMDFPSKDGLVVTADLYRASDSTAPVFLLFHQSGSSRGEYRTIAPRLVEMGYNALAVDLRWGRKDRWNQVANQTALRNNSEPTMDSVRRGLQTPWRLVNLAYGDMEAALAWLGAHGFAGPVYAVGSSFSAIQVFRLARDHPGRVAAVLSFSPGEYREEQPAMVRDWARRVTVPILIAGGADEVDLVSPIFEVLPESTRTLWIAPEDGHGASLLFTHEGAWEAIRTTIEAAERRRRP